MSENRKGLGEIFTGSSTGMNLNSLVLSFPETDAKMSSQFLTESAENCETTNFIFQTIYPEIIGNREKNPGSYTNFYRLINTISRQALSNLWDIKQKYLSTQAREMEEKGSYFKLLRKDRIIELITFRMKNQAAEDKGFLIRTAMLLIYLDRNDINKLDKSECLEPLLNILSNELSEDDLDIVLFLNNLLLEHIRVPDTISKKYNSLVVLGSKQEIDSMVNLLFQEFITVNTQDETILRRNFKKGKDRGYYFSLEYLSEVMAYFPQDMRMELLEKIITTPGLENSISPIDLSFLKELNDSNIKIFQKF